MFILTTNSIPPSQRAVSHIANPIVMADHGTESSHHAGTKRLRRQSLGEDSGNHMTAKRRVHAEILDPGSVRMRTDGPALKLRLERIDISAYEDAAPNWICVEPNQKVVGQGGTELIRRQLDMIDAMAPDATLQFVIYPAFRPASAQEQSGERRERQKRADTVSSQGTAMPEEEKHQRQKKPEVPGEENCNYKFGIPLLGIPDDLREDKDIFNSLQSRLPSRYTASHKVPTQEFPSRTQEHPPSYRQVPMYDPTSPPQILPQPRPSVL